MTNPLHQFFYTYGDRDLLRFLLNFFIRVSGYPSPGKAHSGTEQGKEKGRMFS